MNAALRKLVLRQYPNAKVVDLADTVANPARKTNSGVMKTTSLQKLKSAHLKDATPGIPSVSAIKAARPADTAAKRKGPSGVVMVTPKNTDSSLPRRAKAVIVSRGKVIALQG